MRLPARPERTVATAAVLLLAAQLLALGARDAEDPVPEVAAVSTDPAPPEGPGLTAPPAEPTPQPQGAQAEPEPAPPAPEPAPPSPAADLPAEDGSLRPVTDDDEGTSNEPARIRQAPPPSHEDPSATSTPPSDPARARFEQRFPGHAAATQHLDRPATTRWALVIGINDHAGRTTDNQGSRQDAEDLWRHLVDLGWRQDHVLLLTDASANRENIEQGIAWLARKTDEDSVAVFHYSGHIKKWYGQDADGDGEVTDEGLWPSDNDWIIDSEFAARMDRVRAGRMWVDIGGCNAAGMNDGLLEQPGRLVTYSSTEAEKSYEDPGVRNSVWGFYLIDEGLSGGLGDRDGDGSVTVQEAFEYAAPRATRRTEGQRYGAQNAVIVDQAPGAFDLRIPPPPPEPEPEPSSSPEGRRCILIACDGSGRGRGA